MHTPSTASAAPTPPPPAAADATAVTAVVRTEWGADAGGVPVCRRSERSRRPFRPGRGIVRECGRHVRGQRRDARDHRLDEHARDGACSLRDAARDRRAQDRDAGGGGRHLPHGAAQRFCDERDRRGRRRSSPERPTPWTTIPVASRFTARPMWSSTGSIGWVADGIGSGCAGAPWPRGGRRLRGSCRLLDRRRGDDRRRRLVHDRDLRGRLARDGLADGRLVRDGLATGPAGCAGSVVSSAGACGSAGGVVSTGVSSTGSVGCEGGVGSSAGVCGSAGSVVSTGPVCSSGGDVVSSVGTVG